MKKKLISIFLLLIIGFGITSCYQPILEIPSGKKPTLPIVIDDYISDGAIFQEKEELHLTGMAEPEVIIVVTLFTNSNEVVGKNFGETLSTGKWEIVLEAPRASSSSYRLEIKDQTETYVNQFENIYFGDVWLLAGEGFINDSIPSEVSTPELILPSTIRFFDQDFDGGYWVDNTPSAVKTQVSYFAYAFAKQLNQKVQNPIAIILSQVEASHLDAWISAEVIEEKPLVREFVDQMNRYQSIVRGSATNYDQMSYLFQQKIEPLEDIALKGIIWYHGIQEDELSFDSVEAKNRYFELYGATLIYLMSDWHNTLLTELDIYMIQEPSSEEANVVDLRTAQAVGSFYYTFTTIVPTYDLNVKLIEKENKDSMEEDDPVDYQIGKLNYHKLAERVVLMARTKTYQERTNYLAPTYVNYIATTNQIQIRFANCDEFMEQEILNTLKVVDKEGNLVETNVTMMSNWLYISWDDEETTIADLSEISYAMEANLASSNFKNSLGIPVIPFRIKLK